MLVRPANASDIDELAWIVIAATPGATVMTYRYPSIGQYPDEFAKFSRLRVEEALEVLLGLGDCLVVKNPDPMAPCRVIACAFWDHPSSPDQNGHGPGEAKDAEDTTKKGKGPTDRYERRDAKPARMAAFRSAYTDTLSKFFVEPYPNSYYLLSGMATHPDHQRRGAGKALLQRGIDKANEKGWTPCPFSSLMGKPLYTAMGYREVGKFRTQIEGEEEVLETPAMVYELSEKPNNFVL